MQQSLAAPGSVSSGPRWLLRNPPPAGVADALGGASGPLGDLPARLLYSRGIANAAEAERFLNPSYSDLTDPLDMPGMAAASARVGRAIDSGEPIGVIGDFDVDGLSATALLVTALRSFGAEVTAYVPDRAYDGHGVPRKAVSAMHAAGAGLLITADTGTGENEALRYAADLGLDVIITDHHIPGSDLPRATAIVNPHLGDESSPAAALTGAGVAFKLAQAIGRTRRGGRPAAPAGANTAMALAALGTIADVGPLVAENRIIAREGLAALSKTQHAGLKSLLRRAKSGGTNGPVDAEAVAFQIAPRLNAPGRLGNAGVSLELLVCDDPARAEQLAAEIDALNNERRRLSKEADVIADAQIARLGELPPLLAISSERLHPGLLGPLAGRLAERYARPAVVATQDGGVMRASVRSVPGFDVFAALDARSDLFERHGGHERAAGFSAPSANFEAIIAALQQAAADADGIGGQPELLIDAEVGFGQLTDSLWQFVDRLAPFGEANSAPLFLARGLMPMQVSAVGSGGDHLKLTLDGGHRKFPAIGFGLGGANLGIGLVDAAFTLKTNHWNGRARKELELKAIRPATA